MRGSGFRHILGHKPKRCIPGISVALVTQAQSFELSILYHLVMTAPARNNVVIGDITFIVAW
jgi:hypothetical protein